MGHLEAMIDRKDAVSDNAQHVGSLNQETHELFLGNSEKKSPDKDSQGRPDFLQRIFQESLVFLLRKELCLIVGHESCGHRP